MLAMMIEPSYQHVASKRRCCHTHPLVTESKKQRAGPCKESCREASSLPGTDAHTETSSLNEAFTQENLPHLEHTPSLTSETTHAYSSRTSSTAATPYYSSGSFQDSPTASSISSYPRPHQRLGVPSLPYEKVDQLFTHCAEPEPCTDPSCLDVCSDLIPCQAQDDCTVSRDCFSFPCWDQDCVNDSDTHDICCDQECPQETRCASPHCYGADCEIPVCESFCPSAETSTCHHEDFDYQSFCNFPDHHISSCIPHCGCIDPQCLLQSHYTCEHPTDTTLNHGMPHEPRHFTSEVGPSPVGHQSHTGHDHSFAVQYDREESYQAFGASTSNDLTLDLKLKTEPTSTQSIESKIQYRLLKLVDRPDHLDKPTAFQSFQSAIAQEIHTCQWCLYTSNGPVDREVTCGRSFSTPEELHQHVEKSHLNSLPREDQAGNGFYCHWMGCDRYMCRSFQARPKLKRHVQTHTSYKPFTCSICGIQMKTKDAMEKHERTHTGERPYECTVPGCGKEFATSTELKTHMTIHEGRKPHQCPICQECFADSSNLSKHKKTHFAGRYVCPECGARMKRWDQMRRHIATQEHALELLHDGHAQREYKVRMDKEFNEMPDRHRILTKDTL